MPRRLSAEERALWGKVIDSVRPLHGALPPAEAISSGLLVSDALAAAKARLTRAGFSRIDYVALVNALTLEPLEQAGGPMRLIAAALIGRTRLIDNIAVGL